MTLTASPDDSLVSRWFRWDGVNCELPFTHQTQMWVSSRITVSPPGEKGTARIIMMTVRIIRAVPFSQPHAIFFHMDVPPDGQLGCRHAVEPGNRSGSRHACRAPQVR